MTQERGREESVTLGEEYPLEQARLRELLVEYEAIGRSGIFGATMIRGVLAQADKAAIEGDLPAMLVAFKAMKECQ